VPINFRNDSTLPYKRPYFRLLVGRQVMG